MSQNEEYNKIAILDHVMISETEEETNQKLEASNNCLVNWTFNMGWLQTPIPASLLPPVDNKVIVSQTKDVILNGDENDIRQVDSLLSLQPGIE